MACVQDPSLSRPSSILLGDKKPNEVAAVGFRQLLVGSAVPRK